MRNLIARELHDAHGVRWLAVVREDQFGDPKIAPANDAPNREPFLARLAGALALYVAATASSLARLRVIQHRVLVINEVLRFRIVGIRRRPMLIQRRTDSFFLRGLLGLRVRVHAALPFDEACGMNPGTPVFTTEFSLH